MAAATGTTMVLGGSGFLGAWVVSAAVRTGHQQVVAVSRRPHRAPLVFMKGARALERDLLRADLDTLLQAEHPARVILCAALSSAADCDRDPDLATETNAVLPGRVAAACARAGARLVHVSTDLVFGRVPPRPGGFTEEDPVAPVSHYGRTKAEGEVAVLRAYPAALVVRLPLLYGDSGGRRLGASDSLLASVAAGKRPTLFEDEWRTPLFVGDAAVALVELSTQQVSGVLHVAGRDRVSRWELGCAVLESAGIDAAARRGTRAELGMAATRAADASLDASRARGLLDTPLRGVRGMLDRRSTTG
jgi:dTDP-4-dehydrorhamnose reductase